LKILLDKKGRKYILKNEDLHTKDGVIKKELLEGKKAGDSVNTHLGETYNIIEADITDFMQKAKRAPQSITLKDASLIAGYTGLRSGSKVISAGTGSGVIDMFFANIIYPEKLISYEIREDFAKIAKKNFEKFNIENIEIKMKNIYEGIDEDNLDLIFLDLPEPWLVAETGRTKLKIGKYLVAYTPSIEQAKKFHESLNGFLCETLECIVRNWDMKVLRPHSRMIAHTAFLTIARLIKK